MSWLLKKIPINEALPYLFIIFLITMLLTMTYERDKVTNMLNDCREKEQNNILKPYIPENSFEPVFESDINKTLNKNVKT